MMAEAPVPDTGSAAEHFRLALCSPGGTCRRGAAKWQVLRRKRRGRNHLSSGLSARKVTPAAAPAMTCATRYPQRRPGEHAHHRRADRD